MQNITTGLKRKPPLPISQIITIVEKKPTEPDKISLIFVDIGGT
jgi:hypothetical protein